MTINTTRLWYQEPLKALYGSFDPFPVITISASSSTLSEKDDYGNDENGDDMENAAAAVAVTAETDNSFLYRHQLCMTAKPPTSADSICRLFSIHGNGLKARRYMTG